MSTLTNKQTYKHKIVGLPGDGVGSEVFSAATQVLSLLDEMFDLGIALEEHAFGGAAIDAFGEPLPAATLEACTKADAILLGAIGGPKWATVDKEKRPEAGLLALRKQLNLYANIRPTRVYDTLADLSPLKSDRLQGVDMIIVRELTGGIYFGEKEREGEVARDICEYSVAEVERITRLAFGLAKTRKAKVTSVDKANVLETSRLWRETVDRIAQEFPDVALEHQLVDSMAMHLLSRPSDYDVVLTENLFGDILSDEASMLAGSLGVLPSASFSHHDATKGVALYEPIHGSAPDIAGKGIANPAAMLLSVAMMLRHSFSREDAASTLETAVEQAWTKGVLTADLAQTSPASTQEFTNAVLSEISNSPAANARHSA